MHRHIFLGLSLAAPVIEMCLIKSDTTPLFFVLIFLRFSSWVNSKWCHQTLAAQTSNMSESLKHISLWQQQKEELQLNVFFCKHLWFCHFVFWNILFNFMFLKQTVKAVAYEGHFIPFSLRQEMWNLLFSAPAWWKIFNGLRYLELTIINIRLVG